MNLYNKKFSDTVDNTPKIRIKLHYKKITELLLPEKKDLILDFGCNKGNLVKLLKNYSNQVYGCDISKEAINNSNIKDLSIISSGKTGYNDDFFDKIISSHVIEHINNLQESIKEIERILKPNGICVLIYPFELIRGSNNFIESLFVYKNPFYSRKLHVHKLNPKKLEKLTNMTPIKKGIFWGPYPTYFTVLKNIKS